MPKPPAKATKTPAKPKDKNKAKVDNKAKEVEKKTTQIATLKKLGQHQSAK